jgi:polyribonucleotide nucleotidyltransferase
MEIIQHHTTLGSTDLLIESGRFAEQADASVTVRAGDTIVMATCTVTKNERDVDYLPLLIDFEEKWYAAGKISGSKFIKREGRPSENAVLTARLIDRSLRPLFDKKSRKDIQIVVTVLSLDEHNDPDILGLIAASSAICKAGSARFDGPVSAVRIGMIDGELVVNPTRIQMETSTLDLVVAGTNERVMMIEAGAHEVTESVMLEAMRLAHTAMQPSIQVQNEFKVAFDPAVTLLKEGPTVDDAVKIHAWPLIETAFANKDRAARTSLLADYIAQVCAKLEGEYKQTEIKGAFSKLVEKYVRHAILEHEDRPDGRAITEIRQITSEVGLLPRAHGSGLFTRGQTQALTIATLGAPGDEQVFETMSSEGTKRYMHHYNFPPFSTGEVSPLRTASRREIGHGALAERALIPVIPSRESFPYTIRLVSEIFSSNGSSSMASTCGSTLALMDAGVPIIKPVAGIAMGLVASDDAQTFKVLSDLQGLEDFAGDMDFKIAGTGDGITAIQMDTKIAGLTWEIIEQTLTQAHDGRLYILDKMLQTLSAPRSELSEYAPRIITTQIDPEKIGELIGPGGKNINRIIADAGGKEVVSIDIEEDGTVLISSNNADAAAFAKAQVEAVGRPIHVGEVFTGEVIQIIKDRMTPTKEIGAIVQFLPNKEGMVHISQVSKERINLVSDVLKIGDNVQVKVMAIDPDKGRVSLSIKELL